LFAFLGWSQAQTVNYHAVLRTGQDTVADEEVSLTIEILEGSESGTVVYSEEQTVAAVKGNVFITLGTGENATGSLDDIRWGRKEYYIKISGTTTAGGKAIDPLVMPVTSNPYAMIAGQTATFAAVTNNDTASLEKPQAGDMFFDSENGLLMVYDTAWKKVTLGGYEEPDTLWVYFMPGGTKWNKSGVTVADDGTIYVGIDGDGTNDNVFAINPDGQKIWSYKTPSGHIYGSMALSDNNDTLFGAEKSGYVFALNTTDGSELWSNQVSSRVAYAGTVLSHDGKTLYAGFYTGDNDIKAINTSDGSVKWEIDTPNGVSATPAIDDDGTVYFADLYRRMYAVRDDTTHGTVLWSVTDKMSKTANPLAIDNELGVMYVGTQGNHFYAVKLTDGSIKWENTDASGVYLNGAAIGPDGTVYITSESDAMIRAINPDNGEVIWARKLNNKLKAVPTIDQEGNLYFGDLGGYFYVLDKNGMDLWKPIKLSGEIWASCAISGDGTVYVVAYDDVNGGDKLYAIDAGGILMETKRWPTRARNCKRQGR
jgi:outer membrane protein assembly factor BamB